jgi:hypothetical protein
MTHHTPCAVVCLKFCRESTLDVAAVRVVRAARTKMSMKVCDKPREGRTVTLRRPRAQRGES